MRMLGSQVVSSYIPEETYIAPSRVPEESNAEFQAALEACTASKMWAQPDFAFGGHASLSMPEGGAAHRAPDDSNEPRLSLELEATGLCSSSLIHRAHLPLRVVAKSAEAVTHPGPEHDPVAAEKGPTCQPINSKTRICKFWKRAR
eukprot:CAMPEP_0204167772 /NCGR_PEP_ID=MMETSP0361-20130328/40152_1 /ASSEMBLY_ACC=CAM_ASM_000343 /TAXON_ID=268821 /ORGANISM="Scrippsiella Hangoei, Strain SHTV-5" /LENGTH=145 /DNA_ID=CAMNT_0051125145 /DNA_START=33 /DNA_END=466 /DNA_ORIENTATION=+